MIIQTQPALFLSMMAPTGVFLFLLEHSSGQFLGLHPANERCRYRVTLSLIGWAQT